MALIWRGIFEVDDGAFVDAAPELMSQWLRRKLRDETMQVPIDGSVTATSDYEVTGRAGETGDIQGFRASLFEMRADEQVRATFTAVTDGVSSWAWVDLDRWSEEAFAVEWVPITPGLVTSILRHYPCRQGPTRLPGRPTTATASDGAEVARLVLDRDRNLPIVIVSPTHDELRGGGGLTQARAAEINRCLAGIAPVVLLGSGAVAAFSRVMTETLGSGFDVYGGAIRTYMPGIGAADSSRRHRLLPFHRLRDRSPVLAARLVAPAIQRAACAQAPPVLWRDALRPILAPPATPDDDLEAELLRLERERDQERSARAQAQDTLDNERETAAAVERENDDLRRRVAWLSRQLAEAGQQTTTPPAEEQPFDPDFCGEVPPEVERILDLIEYPRSQWTHAEDLDEHLSASWAKRAWRTFRALQSYAVAKRAGDFNGNFHEFCASGSLDAVPLTWVALSESQTTDTNARFRNLRTLTIDPEAVASGMVYMPSHIKIEAGGYPAPRIHFYDDTGGSTGKVHIGYFGIHLDSKSKN